MFAQSGWLHFVYSYESDLENGIVLPDYSLMPKEYIVDGWYHINEDGKVFEHISTYGDGEGEVYQGSVFTNHSTISWPFFSQHEDEPYTLSLNLGLAQRILDGYERGLALSAEADEMDGRAVVRFLRHHRYDVLNYISNSSQQVQRTNVELI